VFDKYDVSGVTYIMLISAAPRPELDGSVALASVGTTVTITSVTPGVLKGGSVSCRILCTSVADEVEGIQ
jgi:hypothetical protein